MAEDVQFRTGGGKIRSFGVGFLLTVITLGIYYYFWYYAVNKELKRIGESTGDADLAGSKPALSVIAVVLGWILIVPPYISIYCYGRRLRRAEGLVGVPESEQLSPLLAFLLLFPLGFLILPAIGHYWYVTKHQDQAVRGAALGGGPSTQTLTGAAFR